MQQTAISLLIVGRSATSIAALLGLSRSTISRWRNEHPLFAAELARRQREVADTASRRLQLLMLRAIGVIDESLRTPRYKQESAFKVLSALRAATWATPAKPTEAEQSEWPDDVEPTTPLAARCATQAAGRSDHPAASDAHQPASGDVIGTGTASVEGN